MYLDLQQRVRQRFVEVVREVFGIAFDEPALGFPPNVDLGELSLTSCFELAKQVRQPPRKIAEQLAQKLLPIAGVERVSIDGPGYLNLHLDRAALAQELFQARALGHAEAEPGRVAAPESAGGSGPQGGKILDEHTSINPNKAAHIGHLRNAVLGDTFARLLRFRGHTVEVQNYIDNTGVQVADVVVGFVHLEQKSLADVRRLIGDPAVRFDYYCWDLYARVFQYYENHPEELDRRGETLKAVEEGHGDVAAMAEAISTAIVLKHLETMWRIGVRYDLLVQESEILRLNFWKSAFELMKQRSAIRYEESGKNRGCWVMTLGNSKLEEGASPADGAEEDEGEDVKIIVRSTGTVTYVGKDIAYHLWKFGLLGRDFGYEPFFRYPDGHQVWRTTTAQTASHAVPAFGHATRAYAVIDARQSYLQNLVAASFRALGFEDQAAGLHHFAYEVVNLSPACAAELGFEIKDASKGYVEVSGRRGLGIKADDLVDRLIEKALEEVRARQMTENPAEQAGVARQIAVAALRYFLVKYTRRSIITFDFKEALAFEGETGPYLQYTVVRARNIFRKYADTVPDFRPQDLGSSLGREALARYLAGENAHDFWEMVVLAAQLEMMVDQSIAAEEPAVVAKYAFRLAQAFNNFYHHYRILTETDGTRRAFLMYLVFLVSETLAQALDLLGIEVPERM